MRRLTRELRDLDAVRVPATLLPGVLGALGLTDAYAAMDTPLGTVYVAYNKRGIAAVDRAPTPAAFERTFLERFGRAAHAAPLPPALASRIARQMAGERTALAFDLRGVTDFERAVLLKALEIPRGEVRPYAWVAREIGAPRAVRAVGSALGHNPVPLLIPCHRVVRSDGAIGNYSLGGSEAKRVVLAAEGLDPDGLTRLARAGVRYYGSDTTHIFCLPTCRHARRVSPAHLVTFGGEAQAAAAGYRPCKVCRPAMLA